jgi:hypothetical protein
MLLESLTLIFVSLTESSPPAIFRNLGIVATAEISSWRWPESTDADLNSHRR